jgi:hypothetical protein
LVTLQMCYTILPVVVASPSGTAAIGSTSEPHCSHICICHGMGYTSFYQYILSSPSSPVPTRAQPHRPGRRATRRHSRRHSSPERRPGAVYWRPGAGLLLVLVGLQRVPAVEGDHIELVLDAAPEHDGMVAALTGRCGTSWPMEGVAGRC